MGSGDQERPDPEEGAGNTEKPAEEDRRAHPPKAPDDRSGQPAGGVEPVDDWDGLVLDEAFIREAQVDEPAARTRMLRERWRDNPPEPQPWRADEPPAGWFFSKSRRQARKRRKRKDR